MHCHMELLDALSVKMEVLDVGIYCARSSLPEHHFISGTSVVPDSEAIDAQLYQLQVFNKMCVFYVRVLMSIHSHNVCSGSYLYQRH
jgi:hypothetical protein